MKMSVSYYAMETSGSWCSDSLAMIFHGDQVIYLILSLLLCSLGSLKFQEESSTNSCNTLEGNILGCVTVIKKKPTSFQNMYFPLIYFTR